MSSEPDSLFLRNIRDDSSDGEEDDNISITSTVAEPGGDFDVQELLCERVNPENPDEIQFLIRWEGYPLDQCTVSKNLMVSPHQHQHHSSSCLEIYD